MKTRYRVSVLTTIVSAAILASFSRADILYVSTELRDVDKITSDGTVSVFASLLPFRPGFILMDWLSTPAGTSTRRILTKGKSTRSPRRVR